MLYACFRITILYVFIPYFCNAVVFMFTLSCWTNSSIDVQICLALFDTLFSQ